ncbi:uncharacterized protein [Centruroides vittatus]|uniref:uncharacterized protein n=1 Tax=Centruroides vittatus TaxID=120091 RepID=UPI00350FA499
MKYLIVLFSLAVAVLAQKQSDFYDNVFASAFNQDNNNFQDNQNANAHLGRFNFEADESSNAQSNYPSTHEGFASPQESFGGSQGGYAGSQSGFANYPQEAHEAGLEGRYDGQTQYAADEDNSNNRYVQQSQDNYQQPQYDQLQNRFRGLRFINL